MTINFRAFSNTMTYPVAFALALTASNLASAQTQNPIFEQSHLYQSVVQSIRAEAPASGNLSDLRNGKTVATFEDNAMVIAKKVGNTRDPKCAEFDFITTEAVETLATDMRGKAYLPNAVMNRPKRGTVCAL